MGKIILRGMKFRAHIGTTEAERLQGNDLTINLSYVCDTDTPARTDNLDDAVDYAKVYDVIKAETATTCNLIENLAQRIMDRLEEDFPKISHITLELYKHYPSVSGQLEMSGIVLEG